MWLLLVAQNDDGIDAHGTLRGNEAGEEGYQAQDGDDHDECEWICWCNTEEHVFDEARQTKRGQHSGNNANAHEYNSAAQDEFQNRSRPGAERHANPDLACVLRDCVTHHAIDTNYSQQQ
jgi:hypothetical protein